MFGMRGKETSKELKMIVKIHQGPHGAVLVVTDSDLIGKRFEEGKIQLDLKAKFYAGEEKHEEEIKKLVQGAYVLHLTGEKTVKLFLKWGLIEEEKVLVVNRVPHAEVYVIEG